MKRAMFVLLLSLPLPPPAAAAAPLGLPPSWTKPTEPFRLFDNLYWVGTEGLASFLFTTPEGHVLIDTGVPGSARDVMASIEQLGFAVTDIRYLLNTQAHFDHCGGFAALKAASGAQLLASAGDREALERGIYPGWEQRRDLTFPPVTVDRLVEDGTALTLGGLTLTAHMTPGHSPGCTSWSFTARDGDQSYAALLFCSGSVALNRLAPRPQYEGIVADYRETFRRMRRITVDVFLAPHPEQFSLAGKRAAVASGNNPFVDPGEKNRRIDAFERAFEQALIVQRLPKQ